MKTSILILITGVLVFGIAFAEDAAKVNPKVETVLAKIKGDIEKSQPKFPDGATDAQKKDITDTHAKVVKYAVEKLLPMSTNKVFVAEVKTQNDKKVTLDEIKKLDEAWQKAEEETPLMKEKLSNAAAKELIKIVKENKILGECFVMDNQGANVGQNAMTSDYWQGDEPKWKGSYNEAKGGVDIGESKYDKSSNKVDQKVSLPIIDEEGNVIGAVSWGVNNKEL